MDKYNKMRILFEQYSNSEKAIEMSKYMRNMFKFYGNFNTYTKIFIQGLSKRREAIKTSGLEFSESMFSR